MPARRLRAPSSACRSSASARPLGAVPPSRRATPAPGTPPGDRTSRCARLAPLRSPARPLLRPAHPEQPDTVAVASRSTVTDTDAPSRRRRHAALPLPAAGFHPDHRCPRPGSAWRRHGFPRSHGPSERSPNRQRLTPRCGRAPGCPAPAASSATRLLHLPQINLRRRRWPVVVGTAGLSSRATGALPSGVARRSSSHIFLRSRRLTSSGARPASPCIARIFLP